MSELIAKPQTLLIVALVLDLLLGDPVYRMHPIRLIGNLLTALEQLLRKLKLDGYVGGVLLFVLLGSIVLAVVMGVRVAFDQINPYLRFAWDVYILWSMIAVGDLCKHGKRIAVACAIGNEDAARQCTSMLVSRDTEKMDFAACCRAGVESLSENLTDGIISPLFFYFLFGLPGVVLFKVVSTMDSMVGYHNEEYERFGWCGARLDDVLNFIPARLTWLVMVVVSFIMPGYSGWHCIQVGWQQHRILPGWNSGWSEAGAAGALGIKLVGPIWRSGKLVTEIWMGDANAREDTMPSDIGRMILLDCAVTFAFVVVGSICLATLRIPFELI